MPFNSPHLSKVKVNLAVQFILGAMVVILTAFVFGIRQDLHSQQNTDLASIINLSGRQRMLSQNIAKSSVLVGQYGKEFLRPKTVDSLTHLLRNSHERLQSANIRLAENLGGTNRLDSLFTEINPLLNNLISAAQLLSRGDTAGTSAHLDNLLKCESQFLTVMDEITREYEVLAIQVIQDTHSEVIWMYVVFGISVLISAGWVYFFTIKAVSRYSHSLDKAREKLISANEDAKLRLEKLEFLTESIQIGIWENNVKTKEQQWSARLYKILDFEPNEIAGTSKSFLERTHPSDVQKLLDASEISSNTGMSSALELRVKTKGNDYKWVEAVGNIKRDAEGNSELMIGGVMDINERRNLENQLRVFVANAPAAIAMFNTDLEYLVVSHKWLEDYKVADKVIVGSSLLDEFPEIMGDWKSIHEQAMKGEVQSKQEDLLQAGDNQWIKWEVRPWYISDGEVGGTIMFTENITNAKQKTEDLKKAKKQAEEASKAKERFLATMSHEIRTPLNAIVGMTQVLLADNPKKDQVENLNLLHFSGENLLNLINDILDISKIESGKLQLNCDPFDLKILLTNIKNSLSQQAAENLVSIDLNYEQSLPNAFVGDKTRLSQVIYNLAGNAIKFTSEGNVMLSVTSIKTDSEYTTLKISVKDEGIGISRENQDKIFKSFEQVTSVKSKDYGGTGLGLYITKRLLELMGSAISVSSEVGKGSEFSFDIKMKNAPAGFVSPDLKKEDKGSSFHSKKIHILIVEDNTANQYLMGKILEQAGITYDVVSNGLEALEQLQSKAYDMVLMDFQMPVMDGLTATSRIRASDESYFQNIPIILLTADTYRNSQAAIESGITESLSKPFNVADLHTVINRHSGKVAKIKKTISSEESHVLDVIREYSGGDTDFEVEFSGHCIDNYKDFISEIDTFSKERDFERLKRAIHKIQLLNKLFQQDDLVLSLTDLSNGDAKFDQPLMASILQSCHYMVNELKKIK
ncbi:MAG: ATP-binding protein [Cyclobacteriaceae bacterium]